MSDMKKFFAEFKKFITRGNIVDMSVGVIVGGAFTAIVNGLSNNILKPIINWILAVILGSESLSEVYTYLKIVEVPELDANGVETGKTVIDLTQSIYIDWGSFINAIINFLLIAIVLLQSNKASDAGQIITGGNAMLMANMKERGSEKFITRTTYVLAFLFIVICAILSF